MRSTVWRVRILFERVPVEIYATNDEIDACVDESVVQIVGKRSNFSAVPSG